MIGYVLSLTLLAAAVMLVRAVFRKNISSKIIYAMWLAVVLRLCLPFDIILLDLPQFDVLENITAGIGYEEVTDSPVLNVDQGKEDINNPAGELTPVVPTPDVGVGSVVDTPSNDVGNNVGNDVPSVNVGNVQNAPQNNAENNAGQNAQNDLMPIPPAAEEVPSVQPQTPATEVQTSDVKADIRESVVRVLGTVWVAGAAVTLAVFGISWIVFNAKLVKSRKFYGKTGRVKIYVTDKITSPCVAGIIPKIYITPEAANSELLSVILLHEKTHLAHGDHFWSFLRIAAVAAHWWNPVIWLSAVLSKRDAELACDEAVSGQLDSRERIEYAKLIVDMTPVRKNYAVSFAGSPIKERVLKLTKEHKNKIIAAAVAIVLVVGCITVAFIGAKEDDGEAVSTEETTEEVPDTTAEEIPDPIPVYGLFEVYEATEENLAKYNDAKKYDLSTSEYNFSMIIVPTEDITDLNFISLNWNEEILLDREEVIEEVGEVKAGEAIHLTADSVEIIGYVGLSYTVDGETVRYYPATSGMDGSAILVEIGRNLLSVNMLYPGLPQFEVTVGDGVSFADAIRSLKDIGDIEDGTNWYYLDSKVVTVNGLSSIMHIEFGYGYEFESIVLFGHKIYINNTDSDGSEMTTLRLEFELYEYNESIILCRNHYDIFEDSWVFTSEEVKEYLHNDGISTIFHVKDDGSLEYTRYSVKFHRPVTQTATAPLDLATSRDEFFSETGKAYFEGGKIVLAEPDVSQTIGEAYDLDAIFEEYYFLYLGYETPDEIIERNSKRESGEESIFAGVSVMPNENHIGSWSAEGNNVVIREVTAETVKFSAGLLRLFGFEGTATLVDGVWKFTEDTAYYSEEDKIKGRLEFTEDTVTIVYESDGRFDYLYGERSESFTVRRYRVQSTVFVSGVIEPCAGIYTASYGNKILGHYDLTCVSSEESYSLTPRVTICNGGCEEVKNAPIAEYGVEDGWQYPVKVYVRETNESAKYNSPSQYIENKRTANYVFDIGNGMHFNIWITRYYSENQNNSIDNEQEVLDSIAKSCNLAYTLLNNKTGLNYPTVWDKQAKVDPDHLAKAETDIRYKWITSFIGKDVEGCAEVLQSDPSFTHRNDYTKTMAPLKDLYFGSYSVTDIEDDDPEDEDRLLFEFTVVKSDYDAYPVGYYKAELVIGSGMMFDFDVNFIERPMDPEMKSLGEEVLGKVTNMLIPVDYLFDTAYNVSFPDDPYSDDYGWRCMSEHVLMIFEEAKNGKYYIFPEFTPQATAARIYGRYEAYQLHEDSYTIIDGEYHINGHGGDKVKRDIIALNGEIAYIVNGVSDFFEVDIRYYTDIAEFGEAFVVRYTFEAVASVYNLRLYKIEKIKDNGYDNWGYVV